MHQRLAKPAEPCPVGCAHCRAAADEPARQGPLQGWALAAVAAGAFLVPLALAISGAMLAPWLWAHSVSQLVGGTAGLILGMTGIRRGEHRQK